MRLLQPKKVLNNLRLDRKSISGGSIAAFKSRHPVAVLSKMKGKNTEQHEKLHSNHNEEEDSVI